MRSGLTSSSRSSYQSTTTSSTSSTGKAISIYSSGSIAAQKLLFSHTPYGDLTPLFTGYFDTTTGPKLESRSYEKIAESLHLPANAIVFLSDHSGETQAAAAAGLQTVLLAREEVVTSAVPTRTDAARSFAEIALYN